MRLSVQRERFIEESRYNANSLMYASKAYYEMIHTAGGTEGDYQYDSAEQ